MAHRIAVASAKQDFKETENRLVGRFEVLAVDKNGKIVGRGKSPIQDLFVNNFGNILGGLLVQDPTGGTVTVSVTDTGNGARTLQTWYGGGSVLLFNSGAGAGTQGLQLGVGSGVAAPARTDYKIQTQLGSWTFVNNTTNLYNAATSQIVTTCAIVIAAGGTVNEAGAAYYANDSGSTARTVLLARDAISPAVVIPAGASAVPAWTVQI